MAAHFYIRDNLGDWVEITGRVNLRNAVVLSAKSEEGATGIASLIVDDRLLDIEIDPFTPFVATEDTSESDDKVWASGVIANRTVSRVGGGFRDPHGRFWACDVADDNERWHRRVFKAADADRGEETDNERATWLLQQMQDWGLIDDDTTYVSSGTASADLDAEDMRGRYPDDVLGQAAEAKSKNWWLQRQGDIGSLSVVAWWGRDGLNAYSSPLYLTNDLAEIGPRVQSIAEGTSDVWPLRMDHGLRCIPERMYSGAFARHRSGRIYRRNGTTADVIGVRDVVMNGTEQMTKARAINRAVRYLEDLNAEEYRVEARVRLPAAKVTQLRNGMRVPVAMTHWPFGLNEWTWWRVVAWNGGPAPAGPWYDVDLELASTGDVASGPPEPPYEGATIAALVGWSSDANPANYDEQEWVYTGDAPGSGYSNLFTVGPLTPVAGVAGVYGITADSPQVVRISAEKWFSGVVSAAESITLNVLVNGVVIDSHTLSDPGGGAHTFAGQLLVDVNDVSLSAGDVVTTNIRVENDGFLGAVGDNSTVKWSSSLVVGRGTHTIPSGSQYAGSWVGP